MLKTYIGIDVSSKKLNIHVTSRKEEDNSEYSDYEIANTIKSVQSFIKKHSLDSSSCIVGVESTGRYHLLCQEAFVNSGFEFRVLNPILTGSRISHSIRKKKTDKTDALLIADLVAKGEGTVVKEKDLDLTRRTILRTRKTIVTHKTSVKVLLLELKRTRGQRIDSAALVLEDIISKLEESVKSLEDISINKEQITDNEKLIRSIPGFAERLSAVVVTEVRDFKRFPSATQFKAYVGIDPKVTQSGQSLKTGRITKRGNPHLRSAFYLAAQVARCHDPQLKAFFNKKISEGKPTRVAIVAVARKLCERVYAVIKKGKPYEVRPVTT